MLRRKISNYLENFYHSDGSYALLVTGARQVGKTTIIEDFARSHYGSFLEINFLRSPEAQQIFRTAQSVEDILLRLSIYANGALIKGKTLIFLDEIQACQEAITFIKFLVQERSYRYILSGSLLGVELKNIRSVPVGYMREVQMFPLDFEEFLWANGVCSAMLSPLRDAYEHHRCVDSYLHEKMMRYLRLYLVVGGMPAAVASYVSDNNLSTVVHIQKGICTEYRRDISQYDPGHSLLIREIFDALPAELNNCNKRFTIGSVPGSSRFKRKEDGFLWLKEAGVAIPTFCLDAPKTPLVLSQKRNLFKLFANDVGLLASMYLDGIQLKLLNDEHSLNIGAVYENFVAQELTAHGFAPCYFNSKKQGELDFVIELDGHPLPLEVKSGKDYKRHCALNNVLGNAEYDIPVAFVLSNANVSIDEKVTYLPIYMTMFIQPRSMPTDFIYKVE